MITEANYRNFQKLLETSKVYRYFWQFWSNYAFVIFIIALIILANSYDFHKVFGQILILSLISFLVARGVVVTIINACYQRRRPYQLFGFSPITSRFFSFKSKTENSFPSRHSTAYFSVVAVISLFVPAMGAVLFGCSLMAGAGRVVLGYHWPSDIIVGMIIGTVVGILTVYVGYPILFT